MSNDAIYWDGKKKKKGEGEGLGSSAENQKFYFGHTKFGMNVDEMSSKQWGIKVWIKWSEQSELEAQI